MTERVCGECAACCTTTAVLPLDKPPDVRCKHLTDSTKPSCGSCSVYVARPMACRTFACEWLRGHGPDEHRPDQSGVVAELMHQGDKPFLVTLVLAPGFKEHNRSVRDVVRFWRAQGVAVLFGKTLEATPEQRQALSNCIIQHADGAQASKAA